MAADMHYDIIIIGSGAGGSAAVYKLIQAGKRVLLIEKGDALPTDGSTQDFSKVINEGQFNSREPWLDMHGKAFMPEEHFNLGGKTKWYGAALLRFDTHEFLADDEFQCLAWPFGYQELEPYYHEAEALLRVRIFPVESDLKDLNEKLVGRGSRWQSQSLPLALAGNIMNDEAEMRHFDGFATCKGLKADAEIAFLNKVIGSPNLTLITGKAVAHLLGYAGNPRRLAGVMLSDSQFYSADAIILAAGALHSPRLLQSYFNRTGLDKWLPNSLLTGRYFKRHILTAMVAFSPSVKTDKLRKTLYWLNSDYPHSSMQPLGFSADVLSALFPRSIPRHLAQRLSQYAYGFFLQTEDGSHLHNRVNANNELGRDLPTLNYDLKSLARSYLEHKRMVRDFGRSLRQAGYIGFSRAIPLSGTAHACGTLITGQDANTSVVDASGKVHGMTNVYVADGSILPRSSRVNPALTIYAWSLRLADKLSEAMTASAEDTAESLSNGELIGELQ
jgi:choline dehydrogenase-like flavoprotein